MRSTLTRGFLGRLRRLFLIGAAAGIGVACDEHAGWHPVPPSEVAAAVWPAQQPAPGPPDPSGPSVSPPPVVPSCPGGGTAGIGWVSAPDEDAGIEPLEPSDAGVAVGPDAALEFSSAEIALYSTLSPLPELPPDSTNAVADDPLAAALGRALFEDPLFSGPISIGSALGAAGEEGKVSCGTCHFGASLADPASVSTGTGIGTRNSLSLVNASHQRWSNWGGRFSAQWELSIPVVENPSIMNGSRLRVAHRIYEGHRAAYEAVFGALPDELADTVRFPADGKPKPAPTAANPAPADGPWEAMSEDDRALVNQILVDYGKAIAAFLRTIESRDAPLDRFVAGDPTALSAEQQAGLRLFIGKARCITCHNGALFSDGGFHNLGVPVSDPTLPTDDGRFKDIPALLASAFTSASEWSDDPESGRLLGLTSPPPEDACGQFRTPSLRGVALSAPYMHNGVLTDLRQVIEFYNDGGGEPASGVRDRQLVPLHLSDEEIGQLEAFLHGLTGAPVDSTLSVDVRPAW